MSEICNSLLSFLTECSENQYQHTEIYTIPTRSDHGTLAKDILNDILMMRHEYSPTILSLAAFPIQVWAKESRARLSLDPSRLLENIAEYHRDYFGFINPSILSSQKALLEHTDKIIDLVSDILYGDRKLKNIKKMQALRNIHGLTKTNISTYVIKTNYQDAILDVCQRYNKDFKTIISNVSDQSGIDNKDIQYVYHDADKLICLLPVMQKDKGKWENSIDYSMAAEMLNQCITALKQYPIDGNEVYRVMRYHALGYSDSWIANKMWIPATRVPIRINDGDMALSYLVWGYAAKDISDLLTRKK